MEAGIVNITGGWNGNGDGIATLGAFYTSERLNSRGYNGGINAGYGIRFSASRVSSIYGNSNTVTPLSRRTQFLLRY